MEQDYIIKTFRGIELNYTPDTTEQELIDWLQDNIEQFRLKRLREMINYDSERAIKSR